MNKGIKSSIDVDLSVSMKDAPIDFAFVFPCFVAIGENPLSFNRSKILCSFLKSAFVATRMILHFGFAALISGSH